MNWMVKTTLVIRAVALSLALIGGGSSVFAQGWIWTQTSAPSNRWRALATSADGSRVVAVAGGSMGPYPQIVGPIIISTNSGLTWDATSAPIASWDGVASSSDGKRLAAVIAFGAIYTSTNHGGTWTATTARSAYWHCIASSADGMKLVAGESCLMPGCYSTPPSTSRSMVERLGPRVPILAPCRLLPLPMETI